MLLGGVGKVHGPSTKWRQRRERWVDVCCGSATCRSQFHKFEAFQILVKSLSRMKRLMMTDDKHLRQS